LPIACATTTVGYYGFGGLHIFFRRSDLTGSKKGDFFPEVMYQEKYSNHE
jgi:hypothetical protein